MIACCVMQLSSPPNHYTQRWFSTFLGRVDSSIVANEMSFLESVIPRATFRLVLDVCCGVGRHALPLSTAGYSVVAIDLSESALAVLGRAERDGNGPLVVRGDMRLLPIRSASVDAIINMWQSFGQFDSVTNRLVLAEWARALRPRGRLVIDLYNRAFHEQASGVRNIVRDEIDISEARTVESGRMSVTLTYRARTIHDDESKSDRFEWQLYSPEELAAEAASAGLELERVCTGFDDRHPPTTESPRMQAVFVRAD